MALRSPSQCLLTCNVTESCASKIPQERCERRNALEPQTKEAQVYDGYRTASTYQFERSDARKGKLVWGRRWCPVVECTDVEDWADKLS